MLTGILMSVQFVLAQTKTISGKVTDESGTPIANVSVQVKGSNVGTVTRDDGSYSLSVNSDARTLVFSGVGLSVC